MIKGKLERRMERRLMQSSKKKNKKMGVRRNWSERKKYFMEIYKPKYISKNIPN